MGKKSLAMHAFLPWPIDCPPRSLPILFILASFPIVGPLMLVTAMPLHYRTISTYIIAFSAFAVTKIAFLAVNIFRYMLERLGYIARDEQMIQIGFVLQ